MKHVLLPPPSKKFAVRGVFTCALACLMMLISSSVFAQSQTISGTVTDATTNSPLAGAAIMVKGTTVGTISDADGSYRIKAKPTDVLVTNLRKLRSAIARLSILPLQKIIRKSTRWLS